MSRPPLARTPFPHVGQAKRQRDALADAVRRLQLADWPAKLDCDGGRRVSAFAQRGILEAVAPFTDAAGRALLNIDTIVRESGWAERTAWRAIAALEAQGHLERVQLDRSWATYDPRVPHRTRHGQGANVYRIGPSLRVAAGLVELDWTPEFPAPRDTQIASVALPESEVVAGAGTRGGEAVALPDGPKPRGTPDASRVALPELQELPRSDQSARGTPITENATAGGEGRSIQNRSEGTRGDADVECIVCDSRFVKGVEGSALLSCPDCVARRAA